MTSPSLSAPKNLDIKNFCNVLNNAKWYSVATYILGGILVIAAIVLYIRTLTEGLSEEEQKKRTQNFKLYTAIILIVIVVLYLLRHTVTEFVMASQCYNLDNVLNSDKTSNLVNNIVDNITKKLGGEAQKLSQGFASQLRNELTGALRPLLGLANATAA